MEQQIVYGQLPASGGGEIGVPLVEESPYAAYEHPALIDMFYESQGDPAIGTELSLRLFVHADLSGDPHTTPLVGRDGAQVQEGDTPLVLADYINFAARHHFGAVESILDFLMMQPGQPDYETVRATMLSRLSAGSR